MKPERFRFELAPDYSISRIIKGGWQLAGGHGRIDREKAVADMRRFVENGITTFDCADIYTGVEELIGLFLRQSRDRFLRGELPPVQIHTKYVPDLEKLPSLRPKDTEATIDRSLRRLGVERLDLVQFHWWDFSIPGYVETAIVLEDLRRRGKIRHVAVTNFDARHLTELLEAGVPVVADQVQYSLLDRRPDGDLAKLAGQHGISLLCYGTAAGGFLGKRWLRKPPPSEPMENRSLIKYRLIIEEFGGWDLFQELLRTLDTIARRHRPGRDAGGGGGIPVIDITALAVAAVLNRPRVAAVIVGARNDSHLVNIQAIPSLTLSEHEISRIDEILSRSPGPKGPVYALERDRESRHGRIMKYNLNREPKQ